MGTISMLSCSSVHLAIDKLQVPELTSPTRLARITPIDHAIVYVMVAKLPIRQLTLLNVLNQPWQSFIEDCIAIRRMNAPQTWLLSKKIDS